LLRVALPIAGGIGAIAWAGAPLLVLGAARLAAASAFASNQLRARATSIPALLAMVVAASLELAAGAIDLPQSLGVVRTLAAWSAALLLVAAALDDEREAAKNAAAQTEYLAYHDPLTGLANRSLFRDTLMAAISHADRRGFELAVLFIDLDRFKRVNDIAGHSAGDQVLRAAATRMSSCLRREDLLARISGDEFVALIQDANDDEAALSVAFKLLESLDQPLEIAGHVFDIEASIGIARYPRDGQNHDELLLASDRAMYRAKNGGGSRVEFVEPHPLATIRLTNRLPIASGSGAQ
jgi:diguanylate cyclase (GGDEF)-like protein